GSSGMLEQLEKGNRGNEDRDRRCDQLARYRDADPAEVADRSRPVDLYRSDPGNEARVFGLLTVRSRFHPCLTARNPDAADRARVSWYTPEVQVVDSGAGSWCSLVSTLDCQSRGRGFKSRRARHFFEELRDGQPSRSPGILRNSPDRHPPIPAADRNRVTLFWVGCAA